MWETQQNSADWDCFKTQILPETLKTPSRHREACLCVFGEGRTFVPMSWMCKKQTAVSHSSSDSGVKSLDAGLGMDGIPALDSWDLFF